MSPLEAPPGLRWEQHPNNPHTRRLIVGSGPHEIVIGSITSHMDRTIGHVVTCRVGEWSETARFGTREAAAHVCRRLFAPPPKVDGGVDRQLGRYPEGNEMSTQLIAVPLTLADANALVAGLHRHHRPAVGHRFSIGARVGEELVGAIIVGRPVARRTDQTFVFEVTRLVTNGHRNACSFLYARAARVAEAMGARSIQTFTLPEEGGASLRAAGWTLDGVTEPPANGWQSREHDGDMPLFGVKVTTVQGAKCRWVRLFGPPPKVEGGVDGA